MKLSKINPSTELNLFRQLIEKAFSSTEDSSLEEWLSFSYMKRMMEEERGVGIKSVDIDGNWTGAIYAQQENPVNGKEGEDKWVIIVLGIDPEQTGKGIGSALLAEMEQVAKKHGVTKLFTFTNKDDGDVIHFYQKNGFEDAGWIRDYQYGRDNSAVFLLKYVS